MPEFFDKDYTAKEAYGRLYRYARKYRMRLIVGLLAGSITAGSWVPIFQVIQPILRQVQTIDDDDHLHQMAERPSVEPVEAAVGESAKGVKSISSIPRKNGKLPSWFGKVEKYAN
ncbi:MAG: hypothetical protein PHU80_06380, partial [Kiritimatiellae bacterium]|nr:hypothetical protein [Kiritimatiellia bacterium]